MPRGDEAAERAAADDRPRPGLWAGEERADLRPLTQDETDLLIRFELHASVGLGEADDLRQAIGRPRGIGIRNGELTLCASCQRGGIDSDPLVRVLAWRAWRDRDRRWFDDRGVRKGDRVTVISKGTIPGQRSNWRPRIALARPSEGVAGIVLADAAPGERPQLELLHPELDHPDLLILVRVSDRPRSPHSGEWPS
jgi:hypothetical protein